MLASIEKAPGYETTNKCPSLWHILLVCSTTMVYKILLLSPQLAMVALGCIAAFLTNLSYRLATFFLVGLFRHWLSHWIWLFFSLKFYVNLLFSLSISCYYQPMHFMQFNNADNIDMNFNKIQKAIFGSSAEFLCHLHKLLSLLNSSKMLSLLTQVPSNRIQCCLHKWCTNCRA